MTKFSGIPTCEAEALWAGDADAHGNKPERAVSNGNGNPCRHCLRMIEEGDPFLIISHRPFSTAQPYAEQGPVFLHAEPCEAYQDAADELPPVLLDSPAYIVRGYDRDERIVYGSGAVTEQGEVNNRAEMLFENPSIQFIHVRSATNNCWQARIDRA